MAIPTYSGDDNPYNNEQFDILELSQYGSPMGGGIGSVTTPSPNGSGGKRPSGGRNSIRRSDAETRLSEVGPLDTSLGVLIDAANAFNAAQGNNIVTFASEQPGYYEPFQIELPSASSSSSAWSPANSPIMRQIDASVSTLARVASSFQWNPADDMTRSSSPFVNMDEIIQQSPYQGQYLPGNMSFLTDVMPQDRDAIFGASTSQSPDDERGGYDEDVGYDSRFAASELLDVLRSPQSTLRSFNETLTVLRKDSVLANIVIGVLNQENWLKEACMVRPYNEGKKVPDYGKAIQLSSPPLRLKFASYQDALDGLALFNNIYELPSTFIHVKSPLFQASFAATSSSWHRLNMEVHDWAHFLQDTFRVGYLDYNYGTIPLVLTDPNAYCYRSLAMHTLAVSSTGRVSLVMVGGKIIGFGTLPSMKKKSMKRYNKGVRVEKPPATLIYVDLDGNPVDVTPKAISLLIAVACKLSSDTRALFIGDCRRNGIEIQFTTGTLPQNAEDLLVGAVKHLTRMGTSVDEIRMMLSQMFGRLKYTDMGRLKVPKFTRAEAIRIAPDLTALRLDKDFYEVMPYQW